MTDETVRRQVLPHVPRLKATPFVANTRRELNYTPDLLKAIWARITYKHMSKGAIARELGLDVGQVARAIGLGRRMLVKETWAEIIPTLTYTEVMDTPKEPKRTRPLKTEFKWPYSLIKWAMAQAQFHGHGATAIARAITPLPGMPLTPVTATVNLWVNRALKHVMHLQVTPEDCDLYDFVVQRPLPTTRKPPVPKRKGERLTNKGRPPGKVTQKARTWAIEKARKLINEFSITDEELS